MRIVAGDTEDDTWRHVQITSNGEEVPFCLWVDTELGMAECFFACRRKILHSWSGDVFEQPITHMYQLHNFEVWDVRTNQMIAKV